MHVMCEFRSEVLSGSPFELVQAVTCEFFTAKSKLDWALLCRKISSLPKMVLRSLIRPSQVMYPGYSRYVSPTEGP
jgi:hypothetical protein